MTFNISREWNMLPEDGVNKVIYRNVEDRELSLFIMEPESDNKVNRSCIIFIHGGGFSGGKAEILMPQSRWFVKLGFVCVLVEYRLMKCEAECPTADSVTLDECIVDCKEAVRYIRKNAEQLGIDPQKIILVGESAGGYLASAVTALKDFDGYGCEQTVSCVPNLLIVYNPITHLLGKWKMRVQHSPLVGEGAVGESDESQWLARHERARVLSPFWNLTSDHPPVLVVHGLKDDIVPPEDSVEYAKKLRDLGVSTHLKWYIVKVK